MPTIAISYRRADSSAITGRIFDRLAAHYGESSVFMDIDNIPYGIDFRSHIRETLMHTDVLVAVVGPNWIGASGPDGAPPRIQDQTDPVRTEIVTALERQIAIIPVLVDGAKMPDGTAVPADFGNFAFLNALEVHSGRDFRHHMDRLIGAIDRAMGIEAAGEPSVSAAARTELHRLPAVPADGPTAPSLWITDAARFFLVPLVFLLAAHDVIVNVFDLRILFLQVASALIPFAFGFLFSWLSRRGIGMACGFAVALGAVAVVAMTVSESLNSGDPLMPQGRVEWREDVQYAAAIAVSFMVGHVLARALTRVLRGGPRGNPARRW